MKATLIVARYQENIAWTSECEVDEVFIVQKDEHLPNQGREPSSYLWYIIEHYDELEGIYFFSQGNPKDHWPTVLEDVKDRTEDFKWYGNREGFVCQMNGNPHDCVDIKEFLKVSEIEYDKETITFNGCCLFKLSANAIRKRTRESYRKIAQAIQEVPRGEYAFERCVEIIFNNGI